MNNRHEDGKNNSFKVSVFGEEHVGKSMLIGILQEMLPVIHVNNVGTAIRNSGSFVLSRDDIMMKIDSRPARQYNKTVTTSACTISSVEFPQLEQDEPLEKATNLCYYTVHFYETSSRPIHLRLMEQTSCGANLFIFVFDLTSEATFVATQNMIQQQSIRSLIAEHHIPVILVGNKCDLSRRVQAEDITSFQEYVQKSQQIETSYFEISCLRCNFAVLRLLNHLLVMAQPTAYNVKTNDRLDHSVADVMSRTKKKKKEQNLPDVSDLLKQISEMQQDIIDHSALPSVRSTISEDEEEYIEPKPSSRERSRIPILPRNIHRKDYQDGYEKSVLYG